MLFQNMDLSMSHNFTLGHVAAKKGYQRKRKPGANVAERIFSKKQKRRRERETEYWKSSHPITPDNGLMIDDETIKTEDDAWYYDP